MKINKIYNSYNSLPSFGKINKVIWYMPTARKLDDINSAFQTSSASALKKISFYFKNNKLIGMLRELNNGEFQGFMKHSNKFSSKFKTVAGIAIPLKRPSIFSEHPFQDISFRPVIQQVTIFRDNKKWTMMTVDAYDKADKPIILNHNFLEKYSSRKLNPRYKVGF